MKTEQYNIVISQEFLESAKVEVYVPFPDGGGRDEPAWTGMTYLLSGGTNGDSVLTGLTIPVMFKQTYKDIGYYSGFDGAIYQKDINNKFNFSQEFYFYYTLNLNYDDYTYEVFFNNEPNSLKPPQLIKVGTDYNPIKWYEYVNP